MRAIGDYRFFAAANTEGVGDAGFQLYVTVAFVAGIALLIMVAYFTPHVWHHGEAREGLVVQDIVNQQSLDLAAAQR